MSKIPEIRITLSELLIQKGLSKNKFTSLTGMQRTQLNHYCNNQLHRVDLDVLCRICSVLDCDVCDVITFERNDKN